jgi:hypothetical protein
MQFRSLLAAGVAAAALCSLVSSAKSEIIYAILNNNPLEGQRLVSFDSDTRAVVTNVLLQTASPLSPLASIDVRPATGQLYGFDATARQVYTINPNSGGLTAVGGPLPANVTGQLIDFNPTVDLIRLVGVSEENFRLNPDSGVVAGTDMNLAYMAGDTNAGDNPNIRGIGYTNSDTDPVTGTTLYDIDVDNDVLVTQTPANNGTLQTVGPLGVDLNGGLFGTFTGFDISGGTGNAYLTDGGFGGASNLYQVNLQTGAATLLGAISGLPTGGGTTVRTVAAIAVGFPTVIPEPTSILLALGGVAMVMVGRRSRG